MTLLRVDLFLRWEDDFHTRWLFGNPQSRNPVAECFGAPTCPPSEKPMTENSLMVIVHFSTALSADPTRQLPALSARQYHTRRNVWCCWSGGKSDWYSTQCVWQLLLLGVIDLDDIPIDQHIPVIHTEVVGPKLAHFVLNEITFRFIQAYFLADGACAVWYFFVLISNRNEHFRCKT